MNKQQIIIFEGLDMTGKTTILTELSKKLNIPSYKEIREEKWYDHVIDLLYAEEARLQMLEQLGFSAIFDRSYPSEYVYAHSFGRRTIDEKIWELDKRYSKLGAKIIYTYKSNGSEQLDKTGLIDFDKYSAIKEWYNSFIDKTQCHVLQLDTTSEILDNQIDRILAFLL